MLKPSHILLCSVMVLVTGCLLTACQLTTSSQGVSSLVVDEDYHPVQQLTIACEGMYHCEITQIDKTLVIDTQTHLPNQTIAQSTTKDSDIHSRPKKGQIYHFDNDIELVTATNSTVDDFINYYVRLTTGTHEIHVNFYPENNDTYVERFAIIHEFTKPTDYRIQAYRQPSNKQVDSLLDTASPAPLCINLLQGKSPIRKFCKVDTDSQQNEFVEVEL